MAILKNLICKSHYLTSSSPLKFYEIHYNFIVDRFRTKTEVATMKFFHFRKARSARRKKKKNLAPLNTFPETFPETKSVVKKDHAGISWHTMEGASNLERMLPGPSKLCDLLCSPLSSYTPQSRKKRVFFDQFLANDDEWDELSFFSNKNSILENEHGIDRYTSIESSPVKRTKIFHRGDKVSKLLNPLHRSPARFSRRVKEPKIDDSPEKGWGIGAGKITGYNRPSAVRFADLMQRSPNSIRFADLLVTSPIKMSRETPLMDNTASIATDSPSGSSLQTSSTAPAKFIYADTTSSNESNTLHTYDYDDSVLTLDRECDEFHNHICAGVESERREHCGLITKGNERRMEYAIASAAEAEKNIVDECEKLGESMNKDFASSYETMTSQMMEIAKQKSFCVITGDEVIIKREEEKIRKKNSEERSIEKHDSSENKENEFPGLSRGSCQNYHNRMIRSGEGKKRFLLDNLDSNGNQRKSSNVEAQSLDASMPQKRASSKLSFFQKGMCAYNTDVKDLIFSP